jgi:hypothetical protein
MVDLAVDQNDGLDACIPNTLAWVRFREVLKLDSDVR